MSAPRALGALLFILGACAPIAHASAPSLGPLDGLGSHFVGAFTGPRLLLHLGGMASTTVLSGTGVDADAHRVFVGTIDGPVIPGVVWGGAAPLLIGLPLYVSGWKEHDARTIGAASAVVQSSLLTVVYVSLLKAATGRARPPRGGGEDVDEASRDFRFGFWEKGIFFGWPSGHAATSTAVLAALSAYYPEKTWLKTALIAGTAYMLITVTAFNDGRMHWLSDGVAGAMMGYAIGTSVGEGFRSLYEASQDPEAGPLATPGVPRIALLPLFKDGGLGAALKLRW